MTDNEIVAAGGVIIAPRQKEGKSDCGAAVQVLLVHRPKYDDWSFPKGKACPNETLEQTALREVEEETGLKCSIISRLLTVRYTYRSQTGVARPKVVHYFFMKPVDGELRGDGNEVDRVEWLDVREADLRLSYDFDRKVLRALAEHGFE